MAIVSIATLKSYFETGDKPTQLQFEDLIDTLSSLPDNLNDNQLAAITGANSPNGSNPFATIADVPTVFPFSLLAGVPSTSQDSAAGYALGYIVKNTTTNLIYVCTDSTTGAAVWELQSHQIVNFKKELSQANILAGGAYDISEMPAVPGYFWQFISISAKLVGQTTPYDGVNPAVTAWVDGADSYQGFDQRAILSSSIKNTWIFIPGDADTFKENAKGQIDIKTGSSNGDGTLNIYGIASLIKS